MDLEGIAVRDAIGEVATDIFSVIGIITVIYILSQVVSLIARSLDSSPIASEIATWAFIGLFAGLWIVLIVRSMLKKRHS